MFMNILLIHKAGLRRAAKVYLKSHHDNHNYFIIE